MKAMVIVPAKEGSTLELRDIPKPEPQPGELLMRVRATALNRADLYQLKGGHPTQSRGGLTLAGLEAAGEVAGIGEKVRGFKIGDRIMATCAGGYAEYAVVDHRLAFPVPDRLSWEEAATVPVAYMTEHDAIVTNGRLQPGETILVHAASSGVGVAGVQIAKLCGARIVMGTSGSEAKIAALKQLGLDIGINYRNENFADAVLAHTGGAGVDIIIDHVGGTYLPENLRCMALKGRLVSVGRLARQTGELNLDLLALKRLHLIGVTFRTRTLEERVEIAQRVKKDLLPALAEGRLKTLIDRVFPFEQAREAQAYMSSNEQMGKIVLKM